MTRLRPIGVLALVATGLCIVAACGSDPVAAATADELLQRLHRSAALGARWAGFGDTSSIRARVHTVSSGGSLIFPKGESTSFLIKDIESRTDAAIRIAEWDGDHNKLLGILPYALDAPDFDAAKATALGTDQIPVGDKLYTAHVYRFTKTFMVLNERREITWTFWLSPEVPGGEVRRVTQARSTDPTYGDVEDRRIVALDVPCQVGKTALRCYCFAGEDKYVGGEIERDHSCFSDSVPGGLVNREYREIENGKESVRQDFEVLDFHVER